MVYAEHGELEGRVNELGLERLPLRPSTHRPGPATALDLARIVREREIDLVHGWEWPPILESYAATALRPTAVAVGTIMSMSVARFLPDRVPLMVGTAQIRDEACRHRRGRVDLLEPPVDTEQNAPGVRAPVPDQVRGLDGDAFRIVMVSRLVESLKLEGILHAIEAVGELAVEHRVQLLIVGDGTAGAQVREAAAEVNSRLRRPVVITPGESSDPRWAYSSADLAIGMGGSALRSLAFAKPLIVQGEGGFFDLLQPTSLPLFLRNGWYGRSALSPRAARDRLVSLLSPLLSSPVLRAQLGEFGRQLVVERFSLGAASISQEEFYYAALRARYSNADRAVDAAKSAAGLANYKVRRRINRSRGLAAVDDFNAVRG